MKFKIVRSTFLDALKCVQNVVTGKSSSVILQNVLLEACGKELKLTTSDLEVSIKTSCACEVEEAGASTLPVKLLFSLVTKVEEGTVEVAVDAKSKATIKAGRATCKISGLDDSMFPKLPQDDGAYAYTMPQNVLREMLRKVSYATSEDDTRKALKGVLMVFKDQKLKLVATDGRRLALVEKELEFSKTAECEIILPIKTVIELQRSLADEGDVTMMIQKSQVSFTLGNMSIWSKLIADIFPNYAQVIPGTTKETIAVDRQLLLNALDRASVMSVGESQSVKLTFEEGRLLVSSAASDVGEARDEVPVKYMGEKIDIMFNPRYVMDPLRTIDDDEVTFSLNNGHSAAILKCSIPFIYVLMPLRIS